MPTGEDPNKPKKRRPGQAEEVKAPETDFEPTSPGAIEHDKRRDASPDLIAQHAAAVARGLIGERWDDPHSIIAFGTSATVAVQVFEKRANSNARLVGPDLAELATSFFMEAARTKRPLVCVLSLSGVTGVDQRALTPEERRSRVLAHQAAAVLVKSRFNRHELEDGREPLLDLITQTSQTSFRPRCYVLSDYALKSGQGVSQSYRAASGQQWYAVHPMEALVLVAGAMEVLKQRESEFLLQLTSFPKECEPWLVGEKSHAERLHQALDHALAGVTMPAAEESLADVSAPINGVAMARSVWLSLRSEMKEVIEARIRELSEQRFETFEEKAAVAAELHQAMMDWGYRAISPSSGQVAFFRCRQTAKNKPGYFYFEDIRNSTIVGAPDPDAPRAANRIPPFRLADPPPDRRANS